MKLRKNIVFIGMPGCGKTTTAEAVLKELGMPLYSLYDVDKYIEIREGKSIPEIFESGEEYFRAVETKALEEISSKTSVIISTGGGIVKYSRNMDILRKKGIIIFINRPVEKIINSVDFSNRPLLKDNPENLYKLYKERIGLYKKYCDYEIINDKGLHNAVSQIMQLIKRYVLE